MKNPALRLGPALLALAAGLLSGCGGESGGLPSGLGATLQGVKIRASILSLGLSDSTTSLDGQLPSDVVTGVSQSESGNTTQRIRVVIKNAGVNLSDVPIDLEYQDPSKISPTDTEHTLAYIYPTPKLELEKEAKPILVRKNTDPKTSGAQPFVPASDVALSTIQQEYLSTLNGSTTIQNELTTSGVKTVLYTPQQGMPMRAGTFDAALEFYDDKDSSTPFFVSYLKDAATIQKGKVVQIKADAGTNPFDPAQRYAQPVIGKVNVSGIPQNARTLRIRVAEIATGDAARTIYESTIKASGNTAFSDGEQKILFVNRLRKIAVQVEAFIGDASGQSTVTSATPPIAVGRLYTGSEGGKDLQPNIQTVQFSDVKLVSRIKGSAAGGQIKPRFITSTGGTTTNTFPVAADVQVPVDVKVELYTDQEPGGIPGAGAIGPFEPLNSKILDIPATSVYLAPSVTTVDITAGSNSVGKIGVTISDALATLLLSTSDATTLDNSGTFDLTVKGLLPPDSAALTPEAKVGSIKQTVGVSLALAAKAKDTRIEINAVKAAGKGLIRSVVVVATEQGGQVTSRLVIDNVGADDETLRQTIPLTDRFLPFTYTVTAYSGAGGTGAILAQGGASGVRVGDTDLPVNVPNPPYSLHPVKLDPTLFSQGAVDNLVTGASIAGVALATGASDPTATVIRGRPVPVDVAVKLGGQDSTVPLTLFTVASSDFDYDATNGTVTAKATGSTVTVTGSFTVTYRFSSSPAITKTFYVRISPPGGSVSGTVG